MSDSENYDVNFNENNDYMQATQPTSVLQDPPPNPKSKKGRKVFFSILCGILFGTFGAVAFYGVKYAGERLGWISTKNEASPIYTTLPTSNVIPTTNQISLVTTDVSQVVENVMPSVVSVTNSFHYQNFFYSGKAESSGSGIIIGSNDEELIIVTNYHVIENADSLSVTFCDNETLTARAKGSDASKDLAVIAVKLSDIKESTKDSIAIADIGDSDSLKVGEPVIAIGNALGYGQSVTTGVVSALGRELNMADGEFIQTDAAINHGNSGGALLNIAGQVIGINSNKLEGNGVEGMGYAIPISDAVPILSELMQIETRYPVEDSKRAYIGISGVTINAQERMLYNYPKGVYVAEIVAGSPADNGGLLKGDFIYSLDGEDISSMEHLQDVLQCIEAGTTVKVKVRRFNTAKYAYESVTLSITLGNKNDL